MTCCLYKCRYHTYEQVCQQSDSMGPVRFLCVPLDLLAHEGFVSFYVFFRITLVTFRLELAAVSEVSYTCWLLCLFWILHNLVLFILQVLQVIHLVSQWFCFLNGHTNLATSSVRGHMASLLGTSLSFLLLFLNSICIYLLSIREKGHCPALEHFCMVFYEKLSK